MSLPCYWHASKVSKIKKHLKKKTLWLINYSSQQAWWSTSLTIFFVTSVWWFWTVPSKFGRYVGWEAMTDSTWAWASWQRECHSSYLGCDPFKKGCLKLFETVWKHLCLSTALRSRKHSAGLHGRTLHTVKFTLYHYCCPWPGTQLGPAVQMPADMNNTPASTEWVCRLY